MPRVSFNSLSKEVEQQLWNAFIRAFEMRNSESLASFLNNLLTPTEKIMLAKRLMIAVLLKKGYGATAICQTLKVSKTTVNVIRRSVAEGGKEYDAVFKEFTKRSHRSGVLDAIERLLDAATLPVKGSRSSMQRWRKAT